MYVCLKPSSVYVCMPQTYIHETKHTYTVSCHHAFGRPLSMYVCLKTLCFIMEMKHTYTLKVAWKANKIILRHLLSMYVCFKTLCFIVWSTIKTQRNPSRGMASWGSSESNTHRYYINTSIRTELPKACLSMYVCLKPSSMYVCMYVSGS